MASPAQVGLEFIQEDFDLPAFVIERRQFALGAASGSRIVVITR